MIRGVVGRAGNLTTSLHQPPPIRALYEPVRDHSHPCRLFCFSFSAVQRSALDAFEELKAMAAAASLQACNRGSIRGS